MVYREVLPIATKRDILHPCLQLYYDIIHGLRCRIKIIIGFLWFLLLILPLLLPTPQDEMQGREEDDLVQLLRERPGQAGMIFCFEVVRMFGLPLSLSLLLRNAFPPYG